MSERENPVIEFYRGGQDAKGRTFQDILAFSNWQLERKHDYIQWLFPLPEASQAQPQSPVLDVRGAQQFRQDPVLQARVIQALVKMLSFYGFRKTETSVVQEKEFPWAVRDHNFLRLTRILRSLRWVGLTPEAEQLAKALQTMSEQNPCVPFETVKHWRHALEDPALNMGSENREH